MSVHHYLMDLIRLRMGGSEPETERRRPVRLSSNCRESSTAASTHGLPTTPVLRSVRVMLSRLPDPQSTQDMSPGTQDMSPGTQDMSPGSQDMSPDPQNTQVLNTMYICFISMYTLCLCIYNIYTFIFYILYFIFYIYEVR